MAEPLTLAAELEAAAAHMADLAVRVREELENGAVQAEAKPGKLLTAAEVHKRTGIPLAAVYKLGREGKAGAIHTGERSVRFDECGLAEWQRNGEAS